MKVKEISMRFKFAGGVLSLLLALAPVVDAQQPQRPQIATTKVNALVKMKTNNQG